MDGVLKEWTTGDAHDVTDRSFVVRRVIKLNDALPSDDQTPPKPADPHAAQPWVWQRGPWLLVDRVTGHIVALKLPDYDPGVSQVSWFRDYGGLLRRDGQRQEPLCRGGAGGGAQAGAGQEAGGLRRGEPSEPVCGPPEWQREPLRVTFHPTGKDAVSFDIVPGSAVLVEDSGDEAETAPVEKTK